MGELVGLIAGSGFASGLSLYGTALVLGLFGRYGDAAVPEVLTTTPVLVAAAVLTLVEFVADKVAMVDSVWDTVHTVVRPLGAAALGVALADSEVAAALGLMVEGASGVAVDPAAAGVGSALLALTAHGAKASTRVAVNTSPEPFSNPVVSLLEDGLVVALVYVAVEHPAIAAVVVAVLTVLALGIVVALWRLVRRVRARMRGRPVRDRMQDVRR